MKKYKNYPNNNYIYVVGYHMLEKMTNAEVMASDQDRPPWAKNLVPAAQYYCGIVSDIDNILEKHRRETHCTFGTRSSKRNSKKEHQVSLHSIFRLY